MKDKIITTVGIVTLIWGIYLLITLPSSRDVLSGDVITDKIIIAPIKSDLSEYQFAHLDTNNKVIEVIATTQEIIDSRKYGNPQEFVKASVETMGIKNPQFASIGSTYDPLTQQFTPEKPIESTTFDPINWQWNKNNATGT